MHHSTQTQLTGNTLHHPTGGKEKKLNRKSSFFFIMGLIGLCAVVAGFAKTFIVPVSTGQFKAPMSIHIHGAFAFGWILFFVLQTFLIRVKNYGRHIAIGTIGFLIAIGVAVTMLPAGVFVVNKELKQAIGGAAYSSMVGVCTTAIIFLALVSAGMIFRKRKEIHKRLMLLATIVVLWPAWFRFRHYFPSVPRPDIWFGVVLADSFIIVAWIRDLVVQKKIHPVLLYVGLFIIVENAFELLMFDHPVWQKCGKSIYEFFHLTRYHSLTTSI